jgi:uncharacterized membrane protein YhdT
MMGEKSNLIYDYGFNGNEWFAIGLIVVGMAGVLLLPKRFTPMETLFNLLFGVFMGLMFDHTIAVEPFDLYDVGDQAKYQFFDLFSYFMYAPFGYFFIYGCEWLRIKHTGVLLYIIGWTVFAIAVEWIGVKMGLFHYKHGFTILFSIPIYLFVQSLHLILYRLIFHKIGVEKERHAS